MHGPFASLEEGIEAVVDEDSEGELFEGDNAVGGGLGSGGWHEEAVGRVDGYGGLEELASGEAHGDMLEGLERGVQ